ncbi:small GTP-binding protein [Histomonas meleagridis]|uniref:small GTP-binding protein n=1 Tax=Histomonas meleagridis TaxID=135588 RepID=UPI00355AC068|nr:small GTP-binding protein [Histomonas meleagridis]KAH0799323.1 small GTP-binding protein [Histomonas meleagridis]
MEVSIFEFSLGAVGKTALVKQYVEGYFITDYDPTIQKTCYQKEINVGNQTIKVKLFDIPGQEDFKPLWTSFAREGDGFLLLYAIDDQYSFQSVQDFYSLIMSAKGDFSVPFVVCGTKCDFGEERRAVSQSEGEAIAQKLGASFHEVSSLTCFDVRETFEDIIQKTIHAKYPNKETKGGNGNKKGKKNKSKSKQQKEACNIE